VFGPGVALNDVSQLVPGEEVVVRTDNEGQVLDIVSQLSLVTARVRYAQGNQIVLEDARGTTLNIGPNLRFVDARGRSVATANLQAGQTVALYIAPSTRRIYQLSAARADVEAANNPTYTAPGDTSFPNDDTFPGGNGGNIGTGQPPAGTHRSRWCSTTPRARCAPSEYSVTVRGHTEHDGHLHGNVYVHRTAAG
jgi:hypothetical protein